MGMAAEQIEREATIDTIKTMNFLITQKIKGLKELAEDIKPMMHSDKWSMVYDFLDENGYSTHHVTKIVQLIEMDLLEEVI